MAGGDKQDWRRVVSPILFRAVAQHAARKHCSVDQLSAADVSELEALAYLVWRATTADIMSHVAPPPADALEPTREPTTAPPPPDWPPDEITKPGAETYPMEFDIEQTEPNMPSAIKRAKDKQPSRTNPSFPPPPQKLPKRKR